MVVTDPTIDPITGLPLLNPQDVIQQIPLGVQTFPYEDMQATARPTRNPMYGDDILPVSAFVAGQHPTTGSAQTVETDGNHAMKVTIAGGGTSGGVVKQNGQTLSLHTLGYGGSGGFPSTFRAVDTSVNTLLWGFQFSTCALVGTGTGNGIGTFGLKLVLLSVTLDLCSIQYDDQGTTSPPATYQQSNIMFPQPFDLTQIFNVGVRIPVVCTFPPTESDISFTLYLAP